MKITSKKLQIDRAQSTTLIVLAVAVIVCLFSLISAKRLWSQAAFQRHVVNARRESAAALKKDVTSAKQLISNYDTVIANNQKADNVLGGNNTTSQKAQPPDGDNPSIILDALPSTYDFPALISSVSHLLSSNGIINPGISGSDQSGTVSSLPAGSPSPIPIQLSISAAGNLKSIKRVINDLERSIRPFDVTNVQLSGNDDNMAVTLTMRTYFQPATSLTIGSKAVQ